MLSRGPVLTLLLFCYAAAGMSARAQGPLDVCPANSKLICVIPEIYTTKGLQKGGALKAGTGTNHNGGHFEDSFVSSLAPLNGAVGSQLTLLPIGSPGSGLVYVYDPALKTFTASTEDLGPILTERANTTGRHKIRLGFSYQRFSFSSLDGTSLHKVEASFTHIKDPAGDSTNGIVKRG